MLFQIRPTDIMRGLLFPVMGVGPEYEFLEVGFDATSATQFIAHFWTRVSHAYASLCTTTSASFET